MVILGLAGCTAFDVIGILRKKRQEVTGYEVKIEAEQKPDPPQVLHQGAHSSHRDGRGHRRARVARRDPSLGDEVLLGGRDGEVERGDRIHVRDRSR